MKQFSLEIMETTDIWPFPLVEKTSSSDQDVGLILDHNGLAEI